MNQMKCTVCGGSFDVDSGAGEAICPYCDTRLDTRPVKELSPIVKQSAMPSRRRGFGCLPRAMLLLCVVALIGGSYLCVFSRKFDAWLDAIRYARRGSYSYEGMVERLNSVFSYDDAVFAADYCGANWKKEALECAREAIGTNAYSCAGLKGHLVYKKYTEEQIQYALENIAADWNGEAVEAAQKKLVWSAYSRTELINQLKSESFTTEQAEYGVDHCGADWFEQAERKAASYLTILSSSREDLIRLLQKDGFTYEQAVFAADQSGL